MIKNEYIPQMATIIEIEVLADDIKGFTIKFDDPRLRDKWTFKPGQFIEVSAFGHGEVPISIASSPTLKGEIELAIKKSGRVTAALHDLEPGDKVGLRGPYGNWWPYEETKGSDVAIISGGIGLAGVSNILRYMMDNRSDYGSIQLLYGTRTPSCLMFKDEYEKWERNGVEVHVTCDRRVGDWAGNVGLVTWLFNDRSTLELEKVKISEDAKLIICGLPIMMHYCCIDLMKAGFDPEDVYLSLEAHMKCGIGKCGHCNIGPKYVCRDGPIFTYAETKALDGI